MSQPTNTIANSKMKSLPLRRVKWHSTAFVHPSAYVEESVQLGKDVRIWHFVHVREGAKIEQGVTLGKGVFIDAKVVIGKFSKIQNGVSVYQGVEISDFCFIGPHAIFTNDPTPRSYVKEWKKVPTFLRCGSSIGAGSIIRCGVTLGEFSMVGAGSVVTKDVPPFHLAYGLPAIVKKKICACGQSQFPLKTPFKLLLGSCCRKNLMKEMYDQAKKVIQSKIKTV